MLTVVDHETEATLSVLESTARRLLDAARRDGLAPDAAKRLSHLGEELGSHALAARVLVTSGASTATLRTVLERAVAILDDDFLQGGDLRF